MAVPGFSSKAAFTRDAFHFAKTWPSADTESPTELLPLLSEDIGLQQNHESLVTVDSQGHMYAPRVLSQHATGDVSLDVRYSGLETVWALALGFMAKRLDDEVMPEELETGVYRHLYEVDRVLSEQTWLAGEGWVAGDGAISGQTKLRRGTYQIDKGGNLWTTTNAMITGLNLSATPNGMVLTIHLLGEDTVYTISAGELDALTVPAERVQFHDMTLYIGEPENMVELSDVIGVNISLNNNLSTIYTAHTGTKIDEPSRVGPVIVTGGLSLPFYSAAGATLQNAARFKTHLNMMIEFLGDDLGMENQYTLRLWLPDVRIVQVDAAVQGPQQVQNNFQFVANRPDDEQVGFPTNIKNGPLMVECINDVSAHPLL